LSRYKFSLNPKTKDYVEWTLQHYRDDKRQLEAYKQDLMPATTQNYSADVVQSSNISNTTELIGIKLVTNQYIITTERNITAVERVLERCDNEDKQLIDLVYWRQLYTAEGAAMKLNMSRRTAYRKINNILCWIALEMGLANI
jgi:RinA family phage transcriptional activator